MYNQDLAKRIYNILGREIKQYPAERRFSFCESGVELFSLNVRDIKRLPKWLRQEFFKPQKDEFLWGFLTMWWKRKSRKAAKLSMNSIFRLILACIAMWYLVHGNWAAFAALIILAFALKLADKSRTW